MNVGPSMQPEPDEIHLWLINLDEGAGSTEIFRRFLSGDEIERADRLRIRKVRDHFVVARGFLRKILGETLAIPPEHLRFGYGPHGKPELLNTGLPAMHFNLSHSSSLALLAINRTFPIGVDIETARPGRPFMRLAERFFSEREAAELHSLDEESVLEGFYSCWTRKEAYLKAIGTGLATPLNAFDVTLKPGDIPALTGQRLDPAEIGRWQILEVQVTAGYRAAVATRWLSPRLIIRQWQPA